MMDVARVRRAGLALALAAIVTACGAATGDVAPPVDPAPAGPVEAGPVEEEAGQDDDTDAPDPAAIGADELGAIPVLMYHRVLDEPLSEYDISKDDFRAELVWLFDNGYRPIRAIDLARGEIDVPAGTTPVVLTFDDSSPSQARLDEDGAIHPESAVGILLDVASAYDDVDPVASFYVISSSRFGGGTDGDRVVRMLADMGMEIGNHTHDHVDLGRVGPDEIRQQLARNVAELRAIVPGIEVATISLPYGSFAEDRELVRQGSYDGVSYENLIALKVGAGPSPSPFSVRFDPTGVPRIRSSSPWRGQERELGARHWLAWLDEEPGRRYVSDGDPTTISIPASRREELVPALAERVRVY
jgi:peptidoglycan/xylan/chitin deacetylase (PgdA/CDA1 family)